MSIFPLVPDAHPQWQYKFAVHAGTGTEPCGILGVVTEVSFRVDLVTAVDPPLVPAVGIFILQAFTMPSTLPSPQLALLVSLSEESSLAAMENTQVHSLIIWYI